MNVMATLSVTSIVVALLAALLTARIARGPGWEELRYFARAALAAAMFSLASVPLALPVSDGIKHWSACLSFSIAGLHGTIWLYYYAAQSRRPLALYEKALCAGGFVAAILGPVPGVIYESRFFERRVDWLGVTYRDLVPTPLGQAFFAYYCLVLVMLLAGYVRRWRRGQPSAAAHALAIAALLLCGVNDAVASSAIGSMPYLLDAGFLVVVLLVGMSVTSRFVANARALEDSTMRLAETQRELVVRERLAAIGELSAVVAHEVRNPLAVIFNAVAGLKKLRVGDEPRLLLGIVEEEADRLKRIVAELLEFARPRELILEQIEIEPLLRRAVDAALQATQQPEANVTVIVAEGLGTIRCDRELVRQAVINLVSNALVAERKTSVRVVAEGEGERMLRIMVSDDGDGIADAIAERVFVPFFTTRPTGTGLGLPIVRRVADAHGGTVTHEPSSGGGATFVLRLPVRNESATGRAADPTSDRSLRLG